MREIEEMLKIPKSAIDRHIQRLGLIKKLDIWISYELKEIYFIYFIPCILKNLFNLYEKNRQFWDNPITTTKNW